MTEMMHYYVNEQLVLITSVANNKEIMKYSPRNALSHLIISNFLFLSFFSIILSFMKHLFAITNKLLKLNMVIITKIHFLRATMSYIIHSR